MSRYSGGGRRPQVRISDVDAAYLRTTKKHLSRSSLNLLQAAADEDGLIARVTVLEAALAERRSPRASLDDIERVEHQLGDGLWW